MTLLLATKLTADELYIGKELAFLGKTACITTRGVFLVLLAQ